MSSLEEYWEGIERRGVEPDLAEALRARAERTGPPQGRAGAPEVLEAVAARLVPGAVPAGALAAFLDEHFDQQLGRGDERVGVLPRDELIPTGFHVLDDQARRRHGTGYADLPAAEQDRLLADAERGGVSGPDRFDAAEWFQRVRDLLLLGYGSDPRGMVEMGYHGPSYFKGHTWLSLGEVARRAEGAAGHLEL